MQPCHEQTRSDQKRGNIKTAVVSILRMHKNDPMANFNAHKHHFRAAVWDVCQTELLGQFHLQGAFRGGALSRRGGSFRGRGLSGSYIAGEGTADAARDIARSPYGHDPTPILHELQAPGHSQCVGLCPLNGNCSVAPQILQIQTLLSIQNCWHHHFNTSLTLLQTDSLLMCFGEGRRQ